MDTQQARGLFEQYAAAVAYVEVKKADGTPGIASAFHVGDGVFITARHVVEHQTIVEVATTQSWLREIERDDDDSRGRRMEAITRPARSANFRGPFFHPDAKVDVAALVVEGIAAPTVPLGSHLDDWLGTELVLTSAVVMGYPPIPGSKEPTLLAARAEVNAVVDRYLDRHPHFVLSAMARGGFSGGLALSEYGFALGVITESAVRDGLEPEHGYFSVLTVEPIYACLAEHRLLPREQKSEWDGFWDATWVYFGDPGRPERIVASIEVVEDDDRPRLEVHVDENPSLYEETIAVGASALGAAHTATETVRPGLVRLVCEVSSPKELDSRLQTVRAAAASVCTHLTGRGLRMIFPSESPWAADGTRVRRDR
jgi:hypothetical protein